MKAAETLLFFYSGGVMMTREAKKIARSRKETAVSSCKDDRKTHTRAFLTTFLRVS
jgi:hypothetical protein